MTDRRMDRIAKRIVAADSDLFDKAVEYIRNNLKVPEVKPVDYEHSVRWDIDELLSKFAEENGIETEWYEQDWWEKDGFTIGDFYEAAFGEQ